jgi:hypothetical protein
MSRASSGLGLQRRNPKTLAVSTVAIRGWYPLTESPPAPTEIRSEATDDKVACEDIMQQVIAAGAPIWGPTASCMDYRVASKPQESDNPLDSAAGS